MQDRWESWDSQPPGIPSLGDSKPWVCCCQMQNYTPMKASYLRGLLRLLRSAMQGSRLASDTDIDQMVVDKLYHLTTQKGRTSGGFARRMEQRSREVYEHLGHKVLDSGVSDVASPLNVAYNGHLSMASTGLLRCQQVCRMHALSLPVAVFTRTRSPASSTHTNILTTLSFTLNTTPEHLDGLRLNLFKSPLATVPTTLKAVPADRKMI